MARLVGVELPKNKRIEIALTYIYGIGKSTSKEIIEKTGVDPNRRTDDLTPDELQKLRSILSNYTIEGELRKIVGMNIKRLMDLGNYRGLRHRKGLPVRGQRTRTNSRTRKGRKKTVGGKH